jgi:hypothetical protein
LPACPHAHMRPALAHRVEACRHDDEVGRKLVQDGQEPAAQQRPWVSGRIGSKWRCHNTACHNTHGVCMPAQEAWNIAAHGLSCGPCPATPPPTCHVLLCFALAVMLQPDAQHPSQPLSLSHSAKGSQMQQQTSHQAVTPPPPNTRAHSHSAEGGQVVSVARAGPVPGHVHAGARPSPAAHLLHMASAGEEVAAVVPARARSSSSSSSSSRWQGVMRRIWTVYSTRHARAHARAEQAAVRSCSTHCYAIALCSICGEPAPDSSHHPAKAPTAGAS